VYLAFYEERERYCVPRGVPLVSGEQVGTWNGQEVVAVVPVDPAQHGRTCFGWPIPAHRAETSTNW